MALEDTIFEKIPQSIHIKLSLEAGGVYLFSNDADAKNVFAYFAESWNLKTDDLEKKYEMSFLDLMYALVETAVEKGEKCISTKNLKGQKRYANRRIVADAFRKHNNKYNTQKIAEDQANHVIDTLMQATVEKQGNNRSIKKDFLKLLKDFLKQEVPEEELKAKLKTLYDENKDRMFSLGYKAAKEQFHSDSILQTENVSQKENNKTIHEVVTYLVGILGLMKAASLIKQKFDLLIDDENNLRQEGSFQNLVAFFKDPHSLEQWSRKSHQYSWLTVQNAKSLGEACAEVEKEISEMQQLNEIQTQHKNKKTHNTSPENNIYILQLRERSQKGIPNNNDPSNNNNEENNEATQPEYQPEEITKAAWEALNDPRKRRTEGSQITDPALVNHRQNLAKQQQIKEKNNDQQLER